MIYFDRMVKTSAELAQEHLEESLAPKRRKIKGVKVPRMVGIKYNAALQKLVNAVKKDIDTHLTPVIKALAPEYQLDATPVPARPRKAVSDAWIDTLITALQLILTRWESPEFRAVAETIANGFVRTADDTNRVKFETDLGTFGIDIFKNGAGIQDAVQAAIYDNVQLIQSIPAQYLESVQSTIMTNVRAGARSSTIVKSISEQYGVTQNRARFIARDQTAKVNGNLAAKRQNAAGFEYFQWVDSDDERVRSRHEQIADKVTAYGKGIYRWDNPPLSDDGKPITPSQDYQCRCTARPVMAFEVEENQEAGRVNPSIKR